jgi:hypothetical protein
MTLEMRQKLKKESEEMGIVGLDEALAKVSLELMKPADERLHTVSDLTPEEIFGMSAMLSYADYLDSDLIRQWVRHFLLLRVSRFRLGRKEFLLILGGLQQISAMKGGAKSTKDLFAGL